MKLTKPLGQGVAAYRAVLGLGRLPLAAKDALALYRIRKALQEQFEFFSEEERKRIDRCGGQVSPDGVITFPDAEKRRAYAEAYNELAAAEAEIAAEPLALSAGDLGGKITVDDILALEGLIEIKE